AQQGLRGVAPPDLCRELRVPAHGPWRGPDRDLSGDRGRHHHASDQARRATGALRMSAHRQPWFNAVGLARHCVLIGTSAIMVLRFVWMVSLSLKPPHEIFSSAWRLWPSTFYAVENYRAALSAVPLVRYLANGVFVCTAIFVLQILI